MDNLSIQDFITFTASGMNVADFSEIRTALINRYKSVYGSDIDLSTASADGVFVNDLALMINNILQAMLTLYSNLDVESATGVYLDALCSLSNVTRKQATKSNTSLIIKNTSSSATLTEEGPIVFLDNAGNRWIYNGNIDALAPQAQLEISVVCDTPGAIEAPAGFINQTLRLLTLSVTQPNDANVGNEVETDSALRARRSQSSGANGITVLESLVGALLNLSGIEDAYIYNNNTSLAITANDTTTVDQHSIYAIIRTLPGVTVSDDTIGTLIHSKLTPGIRTCEMESGIASGVSKSYTYTEKTYNTVIDDTSQVIYWKQAVGIHPNITITLLPYTYFTSDELDVIGNSVIEYLNKLSIGTNLDANDILIQTIKADPKFKGLSTFGVLSVSSSQVGNNPDTFYDYSTVTSTQSDDNWIITLS